MRKFLPFWLVPLLLTPLGLPLADWVAKDPSGNNIIFGAFTTAGSKNLPKRVLSDASGNNIAVVLPDGSLKANPGTNVQPVTQSGAWSLGITGTLPAGSNVLGAVTQSGPAWSANLTQIQGSAPAVSNPLPTQLTNADGNVVGTTNPVPINCVSGCVAASAETNVVTYAAAANFTDAGTATADLACIWGSATKLVRIKRFSHNTLNASPFLTNYSVIRRSSATTGGTANAMSVAKMDSNDPAPTVTPTTYTTTTQVSGTTVGTMLQFAGFSSGAAQMNLFTFGAVDHGAKSIVLRGTGEGLCLRKSVTTVNTVYLSWEWTEE
jgi:hypothetical protein